MSIRVAAVFLLVLSAAPPAAALEPAAISVSLNSDGSGKMTAASRTNPAGETWSWQACRVGGTACAPFSSARTVDTGTAPRDTIFKATSSLGATATSPSWHGKVSPATRPVVSGFLRANALVTPVPGRWNGGWDGDRDLTELAACAHADGRDCMTLTSRHFISSCAFGGAVVDPLFTGRYLRVAAERHGRDERIVGNAGLTPYAPNAFMRAGPTTAVAIVGRIAPARGPRASDCGPPPLVCQATAVRAACRAAPVAIHAGARGAGVGCLSACRVALVARHGRRSARITRAFKRGQFTLLVLPQTALRRLGAERVTLRLFVDGDERMRRVVRTRG